MLSVTQPWCFCWLRVKTPSFGASIITADVHGGTNSGFTLNCTLLSTLVKYACLNVPNPRCTPSGLRGFGATSDNWAEKKTAFKITMCTFKALKGFLGDAKLAPLPSHSSDRERRAASSSTRAVVRHIIDRFLETTREVTHWFWKSHELRMTKKSVCVGVCMWEWVCDFYYYDHNTTLTLERTMARFLQRTRIRK